MSDPDDAPRITRRSALAAAIALAPTSLARAQPRSGNVRTLNGRIHTPDGRCRCLGYADYGIESGPLVLYCHGLPGSRLEAALLADEAADCLVRLVAIDRPGIGLSAGRAGRRSMRRRRPRVRRVPRDTRPPRSAARDLMVGRQTVCIL